LGVLRKKTSFPQPWKNLYYLKLSKNAIVLREKSEMGGAKSNVLSRKKEEIESRVALGRVKG